MSKTIASSNGMWVKYTTFDYETRLTKLEGSL